MANRKFERQLDNGIRLVSWTYNTKYDTWDLVWVYPSGSVALAGVVDAVSMYVSAAMPYQPNGVMVRIEGAVDVADAQRLIEEWIDRGIQADIEERGNQ